MNSPSALVATLRIARRDAMRHKARSALVVAMVAIPVLGLSSADVLARTMQLSPGERVTREIGAADVAIQGPGGGRVLQGVDPTYGYEPSGKHVLTSGSPASVALQARALAMIGARGPVATRVVTSALVTANDRLLDSDVDLLDLNNPLTTGIASVTAGHAPSDSDQVGVTEHLAKRLDVVIGDSIEVANQPRTVTAVVRNPNALNADTVYATAVSSQDNRDPMLLATTTHPVTWAEVRQLNALGLIVTSRYVAEHPPADAPVINPPNRTTTADRIGIATVAIGLAVLEVVLLAGAAFAVGARRQRRDLALVAAAGGDTRQVRQIVLAGGLVLGAVGAVVGLGAGIAVARIALPEVSRLANRVPGAFDLRPLELLGVLVLGTLTGIISSVLPARAAGREDVVLALSGRRGALSTPKRVPAFGLAMVVIGALVAGHAASHANFWQILGGAVISELGFVFCAPAVVGAAGNWPGSSRSRRASRCATPPAIVAGPVRRSPRSWPLSPAASRCRRTSSAPSTGTARPTCPRPGSASRCSSSPAAVTWRNGGPLLLQSSAATSAPLRSLRCRPRSATTRAAARSTCSRPTPPPTLSRSAGSASCAR